MANSLPVEVGHDLADRFDLDALAPQVADLRLDALGGEREVDNRGGAVDEPGDEARVAGEKAEEIDILDDADIGAVLADREAALVVLGHLEQRRRDEVVAAHRDDFVAREAANRARHRQAIDDRRLEEIGAAENAGSFAIAHEERVGVRLVQAPAGVGDRIRGLDEQRRSEVERLDPGVHQRTEARLVLLPRRLLELARDVEIEEGGEARILVDEAERDVTRQQVAERLLARDEGVRAAALHERSAVEDVARPAQRQHVGAVPLLRRCLSARRKGCRARRRAR